MWHQLAPSWQQRLFTAVFLIISAIAMIAWLAALERAMIGFYEWLFFNRMKILNRLTGRLTGFHRPAAPSDASTSFC
jgi:hypothetical protein